MGHGQPVVRGGRLPRAPTKALSTAPAGLSPLGYALIATVPATCGFAALMMCDRALSLPRQSDLGFSSARFRRGVIAGALALLAVMPLMFGCGKALEIVYELVHYEHPAEHDLLRKMKEAPTLLIRTALIGGALIAAPFFEEFAFRGYLQTLIRQAIVRLTSPRPFAAAPSVASAGTPPAVLSSIATSGRPRQGPFVWQTWVAIVLTSLAFSIIHPLWTAPLIFILSLCLGYAYERTGSLWTSITIHLGFNAVSTAIYLFQNAG